MSKNFSKTYFSFAIVLLEWYEFTVYNLLIPYGIFGAHKESSLYIGFGILALSFLVRPLGSIFFSRIPDRSEALQKSLQLMVVSTLAMGFFPEQLNSIKPMWFGLFKLLQGFAIGGSYGLSYVLVYENEEKKQNKRTNFKLALVQNGWVLGMLIGGITILVTKILVGNSLQGITTLDQLFHILPSPQFYAYGWRFPFIFSGILGLIIYFLSRQMKKDPVLVSQVNPFKYFAKKIATKPGQLLSILTVMGIDMMISHIWFTYSGTFSEAANSAAYSTIMSNLRLLVLLVFLPIFAYIADKIGRGAAHWILVSVCISMICSAFFAPWSSVLWVIGSAVIAAMCYSVLISWIMSQMNHEERQIMIGPMFSIAAATIGGLSPLLATNLTQRFGPRAVGFIIGIYPLFALYALWKRFSKRQA